MNNGVGEIAMQHPPDIAFFFQGENHHRQFVISCQRNGGTIHDLQVFGQNLTIAQTLIAGGIRVLFGIS